MGIANKAHDTKLDRDEALKFLRERIAESEPLDFGKKAPIRNHNKRTTQQFSGQYEY